MTAPNPSCPECHGGGDRETVVRNADGLTIAYVYEPCPCRYRQVVKEEDWSVHPHLHRA